MNTQLSLTFDFDELPRRRSASPEFNPDGRSVKGCSYIYAPAGQAGEYAPLAANPYRGCGHKCAYCLDGETLILMANGASKPILDIQIGDAIIGIIRDDRNGAWSHRYTETAVLNKLQTYKPAYRITLENGTQVICSGDHRWLTDRGWKYTTGKMSGPQQRPYLTTNNQIRGIGQAIPTPDVTRDYMQGYLSGMIKGDAHLGRYDYSGQYQRQNKKSWNRQEARRGIKTLTNPAISRKFSLIGRPVSNSTRIAAIEPLNETIPMYDITTETENFIANGLVSHNCYVPKVLRITRPEFDAGAFPRPNYLELLTKDAKKYQMLGSPTQVMLSFTTDPYHPTDNSLTRQVLEVLKNHGMAFCTLTKGGQRALRDIDLFRPERDAFASTLTSLDDAFSQKWERGASLPGDRIATLKKFHDAGIFTWVSLEPTLDTESSLSIIEATHEFVDLYKVGRANYLPMTYTTNWEEYTHRILELVNRLGVKHYIKKDLWPYLPEGYYNPRYIDQNN